MAATEGNTESVTSQPRSTTAAGSPSLQASNNTPRELNHPVFRSATDPEDTSILWQKWIKAFQRKLRFFRVDGVTDQLDALIIYGGEELEELIDILPEPTEEEVSQTIPTGEKSDFHYAITKLNKHFIPMANKDRSRSQFEAMDQGDLSMGQYYVKLKKQAETCHFADPNDTIRTKILQSMRGRKLRREAMLKGYTLDTLLKQAANKEDVERHAKDMEALEERTSHKVHKVYQQKPQGNRKPSDKSRGRKPDFKEHNRSNPDCQYCGFHHGGPRSRCPASGQQCRKCSKKGHFANKCKSKGQANAANPKEKDRAHRVADESRPKSGSDSDDYTFSIHGGSTRPTVKVEIHGIKGRADADSCASANIMDESQFATISKLSSDKPHLLPSTKNVYAYGQSEPLPLVG